MRPTMRPMALAAALTLVAAPAGAQGQMQSQGQQGQSGTRTPEIQQAAPEVRNQMLADRVFLNLAESPSLGQANIRVRAQNGQVTLSGIVPSEQAKERAIRIAGRTFGVRDVTGDQLRVSGQTGTQGAGQPADVDDGALVKNVAQKLATETFPNAEAQEDWFFGWEVESTIGNWEFDVEADEGSIELHGTVPSFSDIRKVVEAVREVQGVRSVRNNLRVAGYRFGYDPYYDPYWGYGPYYGPYAGYYP